MTNMHHRPTLGAEPRPCQWRAPRRAGAATLRVARLLAVMLPALTAGMAPPARADGVMVGTVSRVHDGDTVTLTHAQQTSVVRLSAVDAPELGQPHGVQARQALQACAHGRPALVTARGTDRHGRVVGQLEAGGRDCGLALLRAGLAWHAKAYANDLAPADRVAYAQAEAAARRDRLGLWADAQPVPPWTHRAVARERQRDRERDTR